MILKGIDHSCFSKCDTLMATRLPIDLFLVEYLNVKMTFLEIL